MRRLLRSLPLFLLFLRAVGAAGAEPTYTITATVDVRNRRIDGSVRIRLPDRRTTDEICWLLFPNRFSDSDNDVNDFSRPLVYPEEVFDPGGITPGNDGRFVQAAGLPPDTVWMQPLTGDERSELTLRFSTRVPHRFGTFGEFDGQLTLLGGWHPVLCDVQDDADRLTRPVAPATYDIDLTLSEPVDVILNGEPSLQTQHVNYRSATRETAAALIIAPHLEREEQTVEHTRIVVWRTPPRRSSRLALTPAPHERLLETIRDTLQAMPLGVAAPETITVVAAPLRVQLTAIAPRMTVISDRAFKVHELIQPFHETQIVSATYAQVIEPTVLRRENDDDAAWVRDALARSWAMRLMDAKHPDRRGVYEWIDLLHVLAIVDRFETAPHVPFVESFFDHTARADPRHEQLLTFNNNNVPGVVLFDKLRGTLGAEVMRRVVDGCTAAAERFTDCAARVSGQDVVALIAPWRPSFPRVNYSLLESHFNEPVAEGFRQTVRVRRDSERPVHEPVPIQLRGIGGTPVTIVWNTNDSEANVSAVTPHRVFQAIIDPDHTLIETTRADNNAPADPQLVLDTAEVEVSSTEFGFAGLAALRQRYDYSKDLALAASYTNRATSVLGGGRLHFGTLIDANSFRHNIYAFYAAHALDSSFQDKHSPGVRTAGHADGFGLRYAYTDIFDSTNPTHSTNIRFFGDIYDRALASDYNFADWGVDATATQPLWTPRTVLAGEVLNGFSQPIGDSSVPLQARFSLGGSRSIRGIGAEEQLARNILVVRAELRQSIYPEFDLNFFDLVTARRLQVHAFVDTGRVSNSAGQIYDPQGFAVGAGVGFGLIYDFFGFFPSQAYVEVATRVDRADSIGNVQVLFGTQQSF